MGKPVYWVMAMAAMGVALWIGAGCETSEGTNGVEITPSTVTLGGSNASSTVELTAHVSSSLALPLEWRVSNPALGTIVGQSGSNAIYSANTRTGNNVVTVRDQFKNEGSAVITQQ